MKNILCALFVSLAACLVNAQPKTDSSGHLAFKGVPLDGTLNQYVSKMKQAGFKHLSTNDGIAILQGDFAGYKDCHVGVSTLTQKDLVYKIAVLFPERDKWSTLSENYFNLKQMLTEKYGNPAEVVERFDEEREPSDDEKRIFEVKMDRCKYFSIWKLDKGEIQLSIDHNSFTNCFIKLFYFDKINGETIKKQALDDL